MATFSQSLDAAKAAVIGKWGSRSVPGVSSGAMPAPEPKPEINFTNINGKKMGKDLRVRIKVPSDYLTDKTSGLNNELADLGGIIFPYMPTVSVEYSASYSTQQPTHSNFPINFYQKSGIGAINITGKFTVQNETDAAVFIATHHLLKTLTKMRSGGSITGDPDSGSPPPVCRLFAHGEWMLNNVPVVIQNYRLDLTDGVDYFTMPDNSIYEMTALPTVSTLSVTCLPMYSRNEMLNYNVTSALNNSTWYNQQGF